MTTAFQNPPKPGIEREREALPKRFYEAATFAPADGGGHRLLLDARPLRTPAKRPVAVPTRELAEALATEWEAQTIHIDPRTMPLTRIVNSALDGVADRHDEVAEDVVRFAGSDLLSYRANAPAGLVARQAEVWDPQLKWAKETLGADLAVTTGVMPIDQRADALEAVRRVVTPLSTLPLAALHVMTTLTGSAVLALAHARGALTLDEAWAAAHVDEDWNIALWGEDAMAMKRRAVRCADMAAASLVSRYGTAARAA